MNTMTYVVMGICLVAVLVLIFVIKYIFSLRRVVPTNEVHIVRRGKTPWFTERPNEAMLSRKNNFVATATMSFLRLFRLSV